MFDSESNSPDNTLRHLATLSAALKDSKPPFCSGTLNVSERSHILFYGNAQGALGRIDLSKATESQLKQLTEACSPATFGRDDEDVLDPSYRKAGKLDEQFFATKLDLSSLGLTDIVRYSLLEGKNNGLTAELYKLNVYDKGSFFKPHKDTPRGTTMLGSLVIVFPTPHEGGALILRHGGKEWILDSGRVLSEQDKVQGTAPVMYAAFFSDVEHEVAPVTSGYRITLTYNLYFGADSGTIIDSPLPSKTISPDAAAFKKVLSDLLDDDTFLPNGGGIGFGLFHQYPIFKSSGSLEGLEKCLKGRDAMIMQVCKELSLYADLWFYYEEYSLSEGRVISKKPVKPSECLYVEEGDDFNTFALNRSRNSHLVKDYSQYDPEQREDGVFYVAWVKDQSNLNVIETTLATYGNEPSVEFQYADVCLIVDIDRK